MYHNFFIHSSVDEATLRRLQGQRRSTNKTVRGAKLCLESNPKPARDIERKKLRSSNKPCAHQDAETPQRLSQNCVWVSPLKVWVSSGLLQGQGLWIQQTWVWHKPSWRLPFTHNRGTRTYTGLGNRLLEGTNRTLCALRPRRKDQQRSQQEAYSDLPVHVEESAAEAWVRGGLLQGWGECMHGTAWRRSPFSSLPQR